MENYNLYEITYHNGNNDYIVSKSMTDVEKQRPDLIKGIKLIKKNIKIV